VALEHVTVDGRTCLDPRGGVQLERVGAGTRRVVVEDPRPDVVTTLDERAVPLPAAVGRIRGSVARDVALRVGLDGGDPLVQHLERVQRRVVLRSPTSRVDEPHRLVVVVSRPVEHPLPRGERLVGVVHVELVLHVVARVDDGDVELAPEHVPVRERVLDRHDVAGGARRRCLAVGRQVHLA
jgi:hypothetical protein